MSPEKEGVVVRHDIPISVCRKLLQTDLKTKRVLSEDFILSHDIAAIVRDGKNFCWTNQKLAHREGRTRSLQITRARKSLTLYPIELGGRYLLIKSSVYNKFKV